VSIRRTKILRNPEDDVEPVAGAADTALQIVLLGDEDVTARQIDVEVDPAGASIRAGL
jgi:hypothetical protein